MATQKYCYIIVHESKGTLFTENYRMPFFWNKRKVAGKQVHGV